MKTPLENPPRFGRLLREFRIAAGYSQETLAERAAMSVNGISALERGANQTPQRETLSLLIRRTRFERGAGGEVDRRRDAPIGSA